MDKTSSYILIFYYIILCCLFTIRVVVCLRISHRIILYLERESFLLELSNPCLGTWFGFIVLVVLVEHKSNKLFVTNGLRFGMVVSIRTGHTVYLATLGGEKIV